MNNELNQLDIQDILQLLPHRYPFLMVDRVVHYEMSEERKVLRAIKNVSFNDIVISYEQGSKGKISEIIMTNYISILSKKLYDIYMELIKNIKVKNILAETKYF